MTQTREDSIIHRDTKFGTVIENYVDKGKEN